MRLLLDTHVYRWVVAADPRLTESTREGITTADRVFVSAASIWEIGIKARLGKIDANPDEVVAAIAQTGFAELPVRALHAAAAARLPMHHRDRFDRMLVAQALIEPLPLDDGRCGSATLRRYGRVGMTAIVWQWQLAPLALHQ